VCWGRVIFWPTCCCLLLAAGRLLVLLLQLDGCCECCRNAAAFHAWRALYTPSPMYRTREGAVMISVGAAVVDVATYTDQLHWTVANGSPEDTFQPLDWWAGLLAPLCCVIVESKPSALHCEANKQRAAFRAYQLPAVHTPLCGALHDGSRLQFDGDYLCTLTFGHTSLALCSHIGSSSGQ
jgi:hypothetical protein